MSVGVGTQLASYEITALLGKGGMGEVYRARDSKLKRDVAIKLLPDEFSRDPERVSRFQREAEALAALNHQNIAGIYDLQQSGTTRFLVLELVEGDTLADVLKKRGALPLDETFQIAKQICEALEAAHEKGIVHRDLKPANIKIMADGKVKVLDFGLAKAMEREPANSALSNSPTLSMAATSAGIILGTAAYMSPEQAKGRSVDRRTDIFAFGAVLFEMLTAQPTFDGEDPTEILSRVVTAEPDWSRLPAPTPPSIQKMLRRALKKDSRQRLGDIRDARIEIEEAGTEAEGSAASASARGARLAWIVAAAAVLVAVVLAIPTVRYLSETAPPEMRVEIITPATTKPLHFALSPDGSRLVFVASGDGPQRLWLRSLNNETAQPLPGTEGAELPFWSPDGRSIGFSSLGKVRRVDIGSGTPQSLVDAAAFRGGAWSQDGIILFTAAPAGGLSRIPATGGEPVLVTIISPRFLNHRFPQFLPDGRHFLFFAFGDVRGIYLGSIDGGEPKRLTDADTFGAYMEPGVLLFMRQGALLARGLDIATGTLTGDPRVVADSVSYDGSFGMGGFSVSASGQVAYRTSASERRQLIWFDRTGKTVGIVGEQDANDLLGPEISPDGRFVAVTRTVQGNTDIWVSDLLRGGAMRFTVDPAIDHAPVWSPDGARIAFVATRRGTFDLYVKPSSGGSEEVVMESSHSKIPLDWSHDGRFLLYIDIDPKTGYDLWAVPMVGERKPMAVANTSSEERDAQFSPDGRWVAYQSDESGRFEIYVQPFPASGGKQQISIAGGEQPRWRADGKELFFIAPDAKLMAVTVQTSGGKLDAGAPAALFQSKTPVSSSAIFKAQYAVSRDGRFLINMPVGEYAAPITLLLNWKLEQKK